MASGSIAKNFINWVSKKRVADNNYFVTCHTADTVPADIGKNITLINADPTSYSKLEDIMQDRHYTNVFVVLDDMNEATYTLNNIALIKAKTHIILVNQWEEEGIGKEIDNLTVLHVNELMAAHLYDNLPNVPLVAQNVGLGKGEIMEILVPHGSAYAFRHIGSIEQRKWRIAAVYRNEKQIIPSHATMIRPNDTLLVIGKPQVLDGIYRSVNKRIGLFPEPFGKDVYLIIDLRHDSENALLYMQEAIYILEQLENKLLYVRILYPNDFPLLDKIKAYASDRITVSICYDNENTAHIIEYDIHQYDIGIIMNSIKTFESDNLNNLLYELKKLVYLFGDKLLYNITKCVILMSNTERMESISTTAFDISESLGLSLMICDYDPEGDFARKKMVIEHYETLTGIFNIKIDIEQKISNPIRELNQMHEILQISPFEKNLNVDNYMKYISTKVQDFLLTTTRHPKLLVPFVLNDTQEGNEK